MSAVTFDLFGTLVTAERPADPAAAVGSELEARGVSVPSDWAAAYGEHHLDASDGAAVPLHEHVVAALESRGVPCRESVVRDAMLAAFDRPVARRSGVDTALATARRRGPIGVLSNCSVPGLVQRTLERAGLADAFDAVVASVDCGRRKPDPEAFGAVADELGVRTDALVHVGDDPDTDGGVRAVGGEAVVDSEAPLAAFAPEVDPEP